MARLAGFEPATPTFGGLCSGPLSYRRNDGWRTVLESNQRRIAPRINSPLPKPLGQLSKNKRRRHSRQHATTTGREGGIRTRGIRRMKPALWPTELPHEKHGCPGWIRTTGLLGQNQVSWAARRQGKGMWWAHQDSNLEPQDYESFALTIELWARKESSGNVLSPEPRCQRLTPPAGRTAFRTPPSSGARLRRTHPSASRPRNPRRSSRTQR